MNNTKLFLTACACLLVTSAYPSFGQNPPETESAQPSTPVQVRPDTAAASSSSDSPEKNSASVASSAPQRAALPLGTGQADSDRPTLEHRNPRYRVMRDDILVLTFPLSPEFNQTITIEPDGYVTLLGAGSVYIQEMTVPEVIEALKKAYSKILRDPIIDVDLKDFQKPVFLVLGQVGKPGQYDLRYDTTVSQGIAIAGSFTSDAKTQVFLFHRVSPGWVEVKKLSLKNILHGKNVNEDVHLQPGDMIYVPVNFISNFKKYVPYSTGLYFNPTRSGF
jgi:polysaccharide export outer membrane protein